MFSPIFATSARRACSTVVASPSASGASLSTAMSSMLLARRREATASAKPAKLASFATKSVSQLTSTITAFFASGVTLITTTPSAAVRPAFLAALA